MVRTQLTFVLIIVVLFNTCLFGDTITVPGDAPTIQAGIISAVDGDTVLVSPGIYSGPGNESINFSGKKITLRSASGALVTFILTSSDTSRTITFNSNEDSLSRLEGFTLSGGYEGDYPWLSPFRGGLQIDSASPIIKDCIFQNCYGEDGGGIHINGGSPLLESCEVISNRAIKRGGGIFCAGDDVRFIDCRIDSNLVYGPIDFWLASGGGIRNIGHADFSNCSISFNRVRHTSTNPHAEDYSLAQAGGINSLGGSLTIDSCIIAHNSSGTGGAIICGLAPVEIRNSFVYNNIANLYSGVLELQPDNISGNLMVDKCSFVCNYSGKISSDGIAFLSNSVEIGYSPADIERLRLLSGDKSYQQNSSIKNSIFAFNSSAPIYSSYLGFSPEISYCNFWSTVSGDHFGGELQSVIGSDGNISQDPLFCSISDSGASLDSSSPCVGSGENGTDIGAFGADCDRYQSRSPEKLIVLLNGGIIASNQALLEISMIQALPWDTLVLKSDSAIVEIDHYQVDKPLYIFGPPERENSFILAKSEYLPKRSLVYLRDFSVLSNLTLRSHESSSEIMGFYAINNADFPCIIKNCNLTSFGQNSSIANFDASPVIRNCELSNGLSVFGNLDIVSSYNYWGCNTAECVEAYIKPDSLLFNGRVVFKPFLHDIPTGIDFENETVSIPEFQMHQNFPNPFNPSTTISFTIPRRSLTEITVYNILGEKVVTLMSRYLSAGGHKIVWDGKDASGTEVASGVYLYQIKWENLVESKTMILLR